MKLLALTALRGSFLDKVPAFCPLRSIPRSMSIRLTRHTLSGRTFEINRTDLAPVGSIDRTRLAPASRSRIRQTTAAKINGEARLGQNDLKKVIVYRPRLNRAPSVI